MFDLFADGLGSVGRTNDRVAIWAIGIGLVAMVLRDGAVVLIGRVSISGGYTAI